MLTDLPLVSCEVLVAARAVDCPKKAFMGRYLFYNEEMCFESRISLAEKAANNSVESINRI